MLRLLRFSCFAGVALALLTPVKAELVYDLAFRFSGDVAPIVNGVNIAVASNQQFLGVELLLVERVSGTSVSVLGNDTLTAGLRFGNLSGFQANLDALGADGQFSNPTVNTTGGRANPNNDADTVGYMALGTFFSEPGLGSSVLTPGVRTALLGTVDLTAPTVGTTTFTLSDFSGANGDFGTWGAGGLEGAALASGGSFNNGSFSVTAVPEPSSLAILGLASCGALVRLRKRHSRKSATV
jgi:hypothetical protein